MKEKIYECPKGCHVSNKKDRCPRCGAWMLDHGNKSKEEVVELVKERQLAQNR